ncbi:MAG: SHOCT domain-containing protein [Clostridia bacterium]|nr:SHOCT domain-containing protein [Clostridia bacterium]
MNNNKIAKVIWIIALVLLISVILLGVASTVLMFFDEYTKTTYAYSNIKYSYGYIYTTVSNPESGIMPLFGVLAIIVAMILFIVARKKPLVGIGTIVSVFIAQLLLTLSVLASERSYYALLGWTFGIVAASIGSLVFFFSIVYIVVGKAPSKKQNNKSFISAANYSKMAQNLREIKDLYDSGIFSKEEFQAEKAAIFQANGISLRADSTLNGVYVNVNSKIAISDNVFSMTYEDRIVKVGTVVKNGENQIILKGEDGKEFLITVADSALITQNGTRYEKE